MAAKKPTPSNNQRIRLLQTYRARGRHTNDLFLVYSVKTERDWTLPSQRQLIHWVYYLETDPSVKTFDLSPQKIPSEDDKEIRGTELDAVVERRDGTIEWHEVKSQDDAAETARSQLLAQSNASSRNAIAYRVFTDKDLSPYVKQSRNWLKAIAYAAVLREHAYVQQTSRLLTHLELLKQGTVHQLVSALEEEGEDSDSTCGLIVRAAIRGHIHLDLSQFGFSYSTPWELRNHEE